MTSDDPTDIHLPPEAPSPGPSSFCKRPSCWTCEQYLDLPGFSHSLCITGYETSEEHAEKTKRFAEIDEANKKASEKQIGGDHYKRLKIQPMEYALANGLNYAQANAIKYITRYQLKGDWRENLEKAIHSIQMLIEFEEKQRT